MQVDFPIQSEALFWKIAEAAASHCSTYVSQEELAQGLDNIQVHIDTLNLALNLQDDRLNKGIYRPLDDELLIGPLGDIRDSLQTGQWHGALKKLRLHLVSFHEDGSDQSAFSDFGRLSQLVEQQESRVFAQQRMLSSLEKTKPKATDMNHPKTS